MNIIEALQNPALLGALPSFRDLSSWRSWLVFLRAVYGLPMDDEDLALFRRHTGRQTPAPGGYPEAVAVVGRQSGKSAVAATVCAFEAATSRARGTYALLVAQDERSVKRTLFNYAREPFRDVPAFAREVVRETADTLEQASGVSLACYPCRPASIRGIRAPIVCVDELAFMISTEGRPVDREMLRAVRPTLATTGGKLLILSSPYGQSGALWDLHRQHFGRDSSTLVWVASAPDMNPTLPADYLDRMAEDDPEAYRSEVLGEFRAGLSSLFDPDALDACVAEGVRERLPREPIALHHAPWVRRPRPSRHHAAHYDPSGGRSDAAALAIAHREGDTVVLDAVRRWPAPHDPASVIADAADVLRAYGLRSVQVDRFGGEFPASVFARHGITARQAAATTSENYLALLPLVNAGAVRLLDDPTLLRELRGLERRRGTSGRDRVDHRRGSHDDVAAATAGVCALLAVDRSQPMRTMKVVWG